MDKRKPSEREVGNSSLDYFRGPTPWEYAGLSGLGQWLRFLNFLTERPLSRQELESFQQKVSERLDLPQTDSDEAIENIFEVFNDIEETLPGAQARLEHLLSTPEEDEALQAQVRAQLDAVRREHAATEEDWVQFVDQWDKWVDQELLPLLEARRHADGVGPADEQHA